MNKLDELVAWYTTLTEKRVPRLGENYHEQATFQDPFNRVRGHAAIAEIFTDMFAALEDPRFRITSTQQSAEVAWVGWTFEFGLRGEGRSIDGASRLVFADDGRVIEHRDFWDASELFEAFPLLGGVVRLVKRKLRAAGQTTETGR